MAEVTGFTADRMRVIENTTVVDGEVQGDNLILMTREGVPIDAGNVRGPVGPQGIAGPVQAVNDQTGTVYAPRIFDTKVLLDAWTTAPVGAMAITKDTESVWEKGVGGWFITNMYRVFATNTDLSTRWPSAPDGAIARYKDTDSQIINVGAGNWYHENGIRIFPNTQQRDDTWPLAPDGTVCEAPVGQFWLRFNGAWIRRGHLVHSYYQPLFGNVNGLGLDIGLNIPIFPFPSVVNVLADVYIGYAPQTGNYVISMYTNNYQNPNGGAHQKYSPWLMNQLGGQWGMITPLSITWPVNANGAPGGVLRAEAQGVSGFYVQGNAHIQCFLNV